MKLPFFLYKIYFNLYLKKHPNQIKSIEQLTNIPNKILVISNTALGDTLLSTPLMQTLKASFPSSKIIALIHENYVPLFNNCSFLDKIIPFYGSYNNFIKTIQDIKKEKITLALIAHGNAPEDIMLAVLAGCEFILKHPTNSFLKKYLSFDFEKKEQHTIEDRIDLARKIGATKIIQEMNIGIIQNNKIQTKIRKLLPQNSEYIGFQIGAADSYKMWPIENFAELAKKILQISNFKIVITGNKNEYNLAETMINLSSKDRIINLCGQCSILELPYLLQRLKFLVTNDTGTLHLAIAIKTPTISLFSSTSSNGIGPYQDTTLHKVIQKNGEYILKNPKKKRSDEAMRLINTDEVFEVIGLE